MTRKESATAWMSDEDIHLRIESRRWDCYAMALAGGTAAALYLLLTACLQ